MGMDVRGVVDFNIEGAVSVDAASQTVSTRAKAVLGVVLSNYSSQPYMADLIVIDGNEVVGVAGILVPPRSAVIVARAFSLESVRGVVTVNFYVDPQAQVDFCAEEPDYTAGLRKVDYKAMVNPFPREEPIVCRWNLQQI